MAAKSPCRLHNLPPNRQRRAGEPRQRRRPARAKSREPMDATADPPRRSFAFGLERAGFLGLGWPRLTLLLILLVSVAAGFGLTRLKVDDSLVGAVPHRHRGVPPLRGDRPPLPVQRVRRAGGGRGQGPPEAAADRGVPPRHCRSAARRRRGRPGLHALRPRQARRDRLRAADRARRPAGGRRCLRRHHRRAARPTRSWPASSCPTTASWRWRCWRSTGRRWPSRAPSR